MNFLQNPKRCRNCFEIRMDTGTKGYSFATETEFELEEWMSVFLNILQHNKPDDSLVKDDHKGSFPISSASQLIYSLNSLFIMHFRLLYCSVSYLRYA